MKKTILLLFTILTLVIGVGYVDAKEVDIIPVTETNYVTEYHLFDDPNAGTEKDPQCSSLFGDPNNKKDLAWYLQLALDIIKYVGIVLCIVLTIVDFAKALLGEEKEMYKPLAKKAILRMVYAVCLFFLPIFVKTILLLIGVYGTCGIG